MHTGKLAALAILLTLATTSPAAVTLTGSTTLSYGSYYVGQTADGTISIDGGSTVSDAYGYIGHGSACTGTATLTGTNSTWTNTNDLYIGRNGNGVLTVGAGASVSNVTGQIGYAAGSTGTVYVRGRWSCNSSGGLIVGGTGTGMLSVEAGGRVSSSFGYIATNVGSSGTVRVTGQGSSWTNSGNFGVGGRGNGTLIIEDGGQITCDLATQVGYNSNGAGAVLVTGTNSLWKVNSDLDIGDHNGATGTMTIQNGGRVSNKEATVGAYGSTGSVTVTGTGSKWSCSDMHLGGTLTVSDGATVTAITMYAYDSSILGNGTIQVQGAALDADLVFDNVHGSSCSIPFGSGGTLTVTPSSNAYLSVGAVQRGTLRIADGQSISLQYGAIGDSAGAIGTATVTGTNSTWGINNTLYVGGRGNGMMVIAEAGRVSSNTVYVGSSAGSSGTTLVSGTGSLLSMHRIYLGYSGTGTLSVLDGGQVSIDALDSRLGYSAGSYGKAVVSGTGSKLTSNAELYVGDSGSGELCIEPGCLVTCTTGYIGQSKGSKGRVSITGAGSKWNLTAGLSLGGNSGNGTLNVADGGIVSALSLNVANTLSRISLCGTGSGMLVLGNTTKIGSITNMGTISFYANPFSPEGNYTPITEYAGRNMTWSGAGAYSAFGGTWSGTATHTFMVAAPTALASGDSDAIGSGERMLFTDAPGGGRVGASFGAVAGGMTFSATAMTDGEVDLLKATTGFAGAVLSGWDFATNLSGAQVMLSFDVGLGVRDVRLWHLSGGTWTAYTPDLMTYDSHGIVSFTVTSFSGYAVADAAPLYGDANRDGIVDQADYTAWYNAYGSAGGWTSGDFNGDRIVDQADYTLWYNAYGSTSASVPEPTSLAMLIVGLVGMCRRR